MYGHYTGRRHFGVEQRVPDPGLVLSVNVGRQIAIVNFIKVHPQLTRQRRHQRLLAASPLAL